MGEDGGRKGNFVLIYSIIRMRRIRISITKNGTIFLKGEYLENKKKIIIYQKHIKNNTTLSNIWKIFKISQEGKQDGLCI